MSKGDEEKQRRELDEILRTINGENSGEEKLYNNPSAQRRFVPGTPGERDRGGYQGSGYEWGDDDGAGEVLGWGPDCDPDKGGSGGKGGKDNDPPKKKFFGLF